MRPALPLAFALIAAVATPALAAPICSGTFALNPKRYTEAEINSYYYDMLEGAGVDVSRVEIWGGCIRAFVRTSNGREEMQFFEPMNLRRVE